MQTFKFFYSGQIYFINSVCDKTNKIVQGSSVTLQRFKFVKLWDWLEYSERTR